jgi:hypothetical protein
LSSQPACQQGSRRRAAWLATQGHLVAAHFIYRCVRALDQCARFRSAHLPSLRAKKSFSTFTGRSADTPGILTVSSDNVVCDSGLPDAVEPDAGQIRVENLPDESLQFLLGSRYCETDRLSDTAWSLFGHVPSQYRNSMTRFRRTRRRSISSNRRWTRRRPTEGSGR